MAQAIKKYPNVCNYCQLQELRHQLEERGCEIHLRPSPHGQGVDVVSRYVPPDAEEPMEAKVGWFPSIPDHCVC